MTVAGTPISRRLAGLVRLVHPFPSVLDGAVVAAIAIVAGGGLPVAALLGIAMTSLQFGIGAVNDVVDAELDAAERPRKPIPAGLVGRDAALAIGAVAIGAGLALSAVAGPSVLLVAMAGTGIGLLYDLALKGTAWAPLAYAAAIPLLPVYAWLGATGGLPVAFVVLVPIAALEGAALAVANPLADLDPDRRAAVATPAVRLGRRSAWWLTVGLQLVVVGTALGSLALLRVPGPATVGIGALLAIGGVVLVVIGLAISRPGAVAWLSRRQLGWEAQAVGAGLLAVGWVLAVLVGGVGEG